MRRRPLLTVLLTPLFMTQADATIVNVAGPVIHEHLHASEAELELVVGGYLLVPGVATLSGAVGLLVLPLVLGRGEHWPAWTWICMAASLPLLAAFVAVERRAAWPLVNLDVIRRPPIAWGLLPQAVAVSTYYALLFTLALYLQQGLGRSALVSGLTLVAWVATVGTVYLSLSADPTHAFATVTAAYAIAALLAGGMAWRATH
jgi:hypothetical protein